MAGLPYLPKSVLDESSTWNFQSDVSNSLSSLQQAGARLMQPVGQQVEEVVRQALPAPAPAPAPPQQPAMPEVAPFALPSLESWGFGARAQPAAQRPEPIERGPQPSPSVQTPSGPAQTPSAGFQGFSLPSLASFGFGTGRPGPVAGAAPQPPTQAAAPARPAGTTAPKDEIDNSSRQAFIRTAYPWALEAADGDPTLANQLVATAISENGKVGTGRSLGEMGFNVGGIQGVKGPAGSFMASDAGNMREFAAYNTLAEGFRAVRDLVTGGRYAGAAATYKQTGDVDRYWQQVNQAGYAEDPNWHAKIGSIRRGQVEPLTRGLGQAQQPAAPPAAPAGPSTPPPGVAAPRFGTYTPENLSVNQLTQGQAEGLSTTEALAVCGPAATLAFSRANGGRVPTLREAKELASRLGLWNVDQGMAGPASEVKLLENMGIPARMQPGADWAKIAQEVQAGKPVIADTPGHYYVISGFDPQTGEFELGQSAAVLKKSGGKTRYRPDQISSLGMGDVRATIFLGAQP